MSNPRTLVIGIGETGFSVAHFLSKQDIDFKVMDTRLSPPLLASFRDEFPEIEIQLGDIPPMFFKNVEKIIVSPGVDINLPELHSVIQENNCECIGDIELFAQSCNKPFVAITGSNGKSTVTTLLTEMAKQSGMQAYSGGNLSPPALDLLENEDAELLVLELSSFQLETTHSLTPDASVVLNISDDHLDRHGTITNYANIKSKIYKNAKNSVINRNDEYVSCMNTFGKVISFGLDQPEDNQFGVIKENDHTYLAFGKQKLLSIKKLSLPGEAGVLNSLAALAIGYAIGLSTKKMLQVLQNFDGLPHRLAYIREISGVKWFNDSKGTNIGATISSLRSLQNNIILIAGGVFKGGDLERFKEAVVEHVKQIILIGKDAYLFANELEGSINITHADSMQHAVEIAKQHASEGDKVLLSPACASFDMYKNYIQRGDDFEDCVNGVVA